MVRASEKCSSMTFIEVYICHRMEPSIANGFLELDLYFQGQTTQVNILTSKRWKNADTTIAIRWEVRYLPWNGATVNLVHHDLDLQFQGNNF